jgi:hypothetical protein
VTGHRKNRIALVAVESETRFSDDFDNGPFHPGNGDIAQRTLSRRPFDCKGVGWDV